MIEKQGLIPPNTIHHIRVADDEHEMRADKYLCRKLPAYSRSFFQQLIDSKRIHLNNTIMTKASIRLKKDDHLSIHFPASHVLQPEAIAASVHGVRLICEHEHFLIVYKPAGLIIHPPRSNFTAPTLSDWIKQTFTSVESVGQTHRPGIVHRLDKDTSGLLIIARTEYAHATFSTLFKNRLIQKTYLALVHGNPSRSDTITLPIGRHAHQRNRMTTLRTALIPSTVREATTFYTVKDYFQGYALVEAKPVTGRTHQIRVHLAAIGHPLVGDSLYNPQATSLMTRHALHAASLSFTFDGEEYHFTCELPDDLKAAIVHLGSPVLP